MQDKTEEIEVGPDPEGRCPRATSLQCLERGVTLPALPFLGDYTTCSVEYGIVWYRGE